MSLLATLIMPWQHTCQRSFCSARSSRGSNQATGRLAGGAATAGLFCRRKNFGVTIRVIAGKKATVAALLVTTVRATSTPRRTHLKSAMERQGFVGYARDWWHFT